MWQVYLLMFVVVVAISYLWVVAINHTSENYPDYRGDDLFGEFDEDDKNNIL